MDMNVTGMRAFDELCAEPSVGEIVVSKYVYCPASRNFRFADEVLVARLRNYLELRHKMMTGIMKGLDLEEVFYSRAELCLVNKSDTHFGRMPRGGMYVTFGLRSVNRALEDGHIRLMDLRGHSIAEYPVDNEREALAYDAVGLVMQSVEDYAFHAKNVELTQQGVLWFSALRISEEVAEGYLKLDVGLAA